MKNLLNPGKPSWLFLCIASILPMVSSWATDESFDNAKCPIVYKFQEVPGQTAEVMEILNTMAEAAESLKAVKFEYLRGRPANTPNEGNPMYIRQTDGNFYVVTYVDADNIQTIPLQKIKNVKIITLKPETFKDDGNSSYKDVEAYASLKQFVNGLTAIKARQDNLSSIRLYFGYFPGRSYDGAILQISKIVSINATNAEPYILVEVDPKSTLDVGLLTTLIGDEKLYNDRRFKLPLRLLRKITSVSRNS